MYLKKSKIVEVLVKDLKIVVLVSRVNEENY